MTAKSFSIVKARRRLSALCKSAFDRDFTPRRAFFTSQMRKIFKNNRIIKVLKLIGYILFYIALFLGVIIAINYIEGNGIRSAIN